MGVGVGVSVGVDVSVSALRRAGVGVGIGVSVGVAIASQLLGTASDVFEHAARGDKSASGQPAAPTPYGRPAVHLAPSQSPAALPLSSVGSLGLGAETCSMSDFGTG